jgi:hypothetical protein
VPSRFGEIGAATRCGNAPTFIAAVEYLAKNFDIRRAAPEGAIDFVELAVSLKRYPDTERSSQLDVSRIYFAAVASVTGG